MNHNLRSTCGQLIINKIKALPLIQHQNFLKAGYTLYSVVITVFKTVVEKSLYYLFLTC